MITRHLKIGICVTAMLGWAVTADAQQLREKPDYAKQIGVDQKIGESLDLNLKFHDEQNNYVSLGDFFDGRRPVVLSFNYSNCPRLCIVQFNNLVAALNDIDLRPLDDFQVVSISLDPREKPSTALETKLKYLASYGELDTRDGWSFLVGNLPSIESLADQCGVQYVYVPEEDFYSHPSVFVFCSPSGKIIRYLNGLDGDLASKLTPAIVEASEGKVGGLIDKALYFSGCYEWDPTTGKYTPVAMRLMRWGGALTAVVLIAAIAPFWISAARRKKHSGVATEDPALRQSNESLISETN